MKPNHSIVRAFLADLHELAARACEGLDHPGVLQLSKVHPETDKLIVSGRFNIGDVNAMADAAIADAESGYNSYVEARTIRRETPPRERGEGETATRAVFALNLDRDGDKGMAGAEFLEPTMRVKTSPGNGHDWLVLDKALSYETARKLGATIRKKIGADNDTGVPTQPYRVAGTPNYPNAIKRERGRTTCETQYVNGGPVYSYEMLLEAAGGVLVDDGADNPRKPLTDVVGVRPDVPITSLDDDRLKPLWPAVKYMIENAKPPNGAPAKHKGGSGHCFVIGALIRAGLNNAQIKAVYRLGKIANGPAGHGRGFDGYVERVIAWCRNVAGFFPCVLRFDDAAQEFRGQLEQQHLDLQACEAINKKLAAHIGKYDGLFGRLCVVWHCIENINLPELPDLIAVDTARRVARFLHEYLLPHAIAFYTEILGLSDEHERLTAVAGYILARKLERVTNRDVAHGDRTMRKLTRRDSDNVFEQLDALGWVERTPAPRPSDPPHWIVNPEVHKRFSARAVSEAKRRAAAREAILAAIRASRANGDTDE